MLIKTKCRYCATKMLVFVNFTSYLDGSCHKRTAVNNSSAIFNYFYTRKQLLLWRILVIAILSVCLSVRPTHGWVTQKR